VFFCQLSSEFFSELVHIFTENGAVLLGEIDMLERAVSRRNSTRLNEKSAVQTVFI